MLPQGVDNSAPTVAEANVSIGRDCAEKPVNLSSRAIFGLDFYP
jgi:hypothetical protein